MIFFEAVLEMCLNFICYSNVDLPCVGILNQRIGKFCMLRSKKVADRNSLLISSMYKGHNQRMNLLGARFPKIMLKSQAFYDREYHLDLDRLETLTKASKP